MFQTIESSYYELCLYSDIAFTDVAYKIATLWRKLEMTNQRLPETSIQQLPHLWREKYLKRSPLGNICSVRRGWVGQVKEPTGISYLSTFVKMNAFHLIVSQELILQSFVEWMHFSVEILHSFHRLTDTWRTNLLTRWLPYMKHV